MHTITELLASDSLANFDNDEAIAAIALLVDHAGNVADADLAKRALAWCDELELRNHASIDRTLMDYSAMR